MSSKLLGIFAGFPALVDRSLICEKCGRFDDTIARGRGAYSPPVALELSPDSAAAPPPSNYYLGTAHPRNLVDQVAVESNRWQSGEALRMTNKIDNARELAEATLDRRSKVLNSTVRPAGGPNGLATESQTAALDPLQKACLAAGQEIAVLLVDQKYPPTASELASIIYKHQRNGREL
jgi:hypothetical protein